MQRKAAEALLESDDVDEAVGGAAGQLDLATGSRKRPMHSPSPPPPPPPPPPGSGLVSSWSPDAADQHASSAHLTMPYAVVEATACSDSEDGGNVEVAEEIWAPCTM